LTESFEELARGEKEGEMVAERRAVIFDQLDKLTSRARYLQRSMTVFYVALGLFVATSVAIGIVAFAGAVWGILPVLTGLLGAAFLFYGSVILIFEARLALSTITSEMDFLWKLSQHYAPRELVDQRSPHYNRLTLRRR